MSALAKLDHPKSPAKNGETSPAFARPDVTIYETKTGYVVLAEMPGVDRDGLEITVEDNELTLTGRRDSDAPKAELIMRESHGADYRRVFELAPDVDKNRISARIEQGLVAVTLFKTEKSQPQKIRVE
jgi:HSP20 family protein